jgi:hypothetical protein
MKDLTWKLAWKYNKIVLIVAFFGCNAVNLILNEELDLHI